MTSDFSAQFRPRYAWNDDVMRAAWWWAMWWPWLNSAVYGGEGQGRLLFVNKK